MGCGHQLEASWDCRRPGSTPTVCPTADRSDSYTKGPQSTETSGPCGLQRYTQAPMITRPLVSRSRLGLEGVPEGKGAYHSSVHRICTRYLTMAVTPAPGDQRPSSLHGHCTHVHMHSTHTVLKNNKPRAGEMAQWVSVKGPEFRQPAHT